MIPATCTRACLAALLVLAAGAAAQAPESDLSRAATAHSRRDYGQALTLLLPLARAGDADAQLRLGLMYFHGQGVREDDAQAFAWLHRAASAGLPDAQFHFANMYAFGFGVPPDELEPDVAAALWYFAAANQGHAEAQHSLGILFLSGKGLVTSPEEAMRWFRRAAAAGHRESKRIVEDHGQSR